MSKKPLVGYRYLLPAVVDPPKRVCVQIEVPDDPAYWSAFWGALDTLCQAYRWANDSSHTAKAVVQVMRSMVLAARPGNCVTTPAFSGGGDIETLIRQNPTNPCLVESSMDGVHWCPLIDISLCINPGTQPGAGAEQPPPGGGCVTYNAQMPATGVWLAPTVVNSGDTIEVLNADGATNDGTVSPWHCPDGNTFFAGTCVPGTGGTSGGDPLNTVNHLRLIANIGGTFYDMMGGPVTVPGGVSNAQVIFQVNDSSLSDNLGSISFAVKVCNNGTATFTHTFDFELSNQSFSVVSYGTWSAGVGWLGDLNAQVIQGREIEIHRTFSSVQLTSMTLTYNRGAGGDGVVTLRAKHTGSTVYQYQNSPGPDSGSGLTVNTSGERLVDEIYININSHPATTPVTVVTLVVNGIGSDPF